MNLKHYDLNLKHYDLTMTFSTKLLGTQSRAYFHRDGQKRPVLLDRHIIGYLKEASASLADVLEPGLSRALANKVFVQPRELLLCPPPGTQVGRDERPRRLSDGQSAHVEIVWSEAMPIGTQVSCQLIVYPGFNEQSLRALLDYGQHRGLGQFRGGGYGRFTYELTQRNGEAD